MTLIRAASADKTMEERRARQLAKLDELRKRLRGAANAGLGIAQVREEYPELTGFLFSGRDMRNVDFRNTDLRDLDLRGSDLSGANFSDARIAGAHLEYCKVSRYALMQAQDWDDYHDNWAPHQDEKNGRPSGFTRSPGERFSFSPLLPEVILLDGSKLSSDHRIDEAEAEALASGRLAIAVNTLTNREIIAPTQHASSNDDRTAHPLYTATSYCTQLTHRGTEFGLPVGTRVRIPSFGLFCCIAHAPPAASVPPATGFETDLSPRALNLGTGGAEFVWLDAGKRLAISNVEKHAGGERAVSPVSEPEQFAMVRPVYHLGTI